MNKGVRFHPCGNGLVAIGIIKLLENGDAEAIHNMNSSKKLKRSEPGLTSFPLKIIHIINHQIEGRRGGIRVGRTRVGRP